MFVDLSAFWCYNGVSGVALDLQGDVKYILKSMFAKALRRFIIKGYE